VKLIAHCISRNCNNKSDSYYSDSDLDEHDLGVLERAGYVEVWFWYENGGYEGQGELLGRNTEGKWNYETFGHCSCYGPTDDADAMRGSYESLEKLTEGYTPERMAEIQCLLDAIKESQS
jgi:hypothetical protein